MKINIIGGNGVMGSVHKKVFEDAGHEVFSSGRNSFPTIEKAAEESDLTIISVPIKVTEEVIKKVAPFCKAIMDFTGLKDFPVKAMLKYSKEDCEVGGLHPLYGNVKSIKGRNIIYCPTTKSGKLCGDVVKCFEKAGAKIKIMEPGKHDLLVGAIGQNARLKLFETYALLLKENGIEVSELYEIATPPTRILLDFIGRQVDKSNDDLYKQMKDFNPFTKKVEAEIKELFDYSNVDHSKIRELYGDKLKEVQERAKRIIEFN